MSPPSPQIGDGDDGATEREDANPRHKRLISEYPYFDCLDPIGTRPMIDQGRLVPSFMLTL